MQEQNSKAAQCPVCGKGISNKRKYCSWNCYCSAGIGNYKQRQIPYRERPCQKCGKLFKTQIGSAINDRQFCSRKCSGSSHSKDWVELICRTCKKSFSVTPSRIDKAVYCSQSCVPKLKPWTITTKSCANCLKEFTRPRNANRPDLFCSKECHYEYRKRETELTLDNNPKWGLYRCAFCKIVFRKMKCAVAGKRTFCSSTCTASYTIRYINKRVSAAETRFLDMVEAKHGIKIERQCRVGRYAVDGVWRSHRVAFEYDGEVWHERPETKVSDEKKSIAIAWAGLKLVRVSHKEFTRQPEATVMKAITAALFL